MQQDLIYNVISNLENFIDGLTFIDSEGTIIYHKNFPNTSLHIKESDTIGKRLEEVFLNYDTDRSPLYRALKYGEYTVNQIQPLEFYNGERILTVNTVYPVKKDNKIVGAVSASQIINPEGGQDHYIDLSRSLSGVISSTTVKTLFNVSNIIGISAGTERLKTEILKASETKSNVLIVGETGTGKELAAQSIHSHSNRNHKPFVVQNCAAIPPTLLESLFFGTTKGSFTGATDSPGIFEQASGGTVFLDEINSMDITLQSKLLRVLEDGMVTRLGGRNSVHVDVRIISATNQPPKVCMAKELLRRDLYFRLSTLQITLPTLAERIEDIRPLVRHYIEHFNKEMSKSIVDVTPEVYDLFRKYDWPGNIRELKNVLETAFNFAEDSYIRLEDIPDYVLCTQGGGEASTAAAGGLSSAGCDLSRPLRDATEDFEKNYILAHVPQCGSLVELADSLHISKQLLYHKIKKYDLKITF